MYADRVFYLSAFFRQTAAHLPASEPPGKIDNESGAPISASQAQATPSEGHPRASTVRLFGRIIGESAGKAKESGRIIGESTGKAEKPRNASGWGPGEGEPATGQAAGGGGNQRRKATGSEKPGGGRRRGGGGGLENQTPAIGRPPGYRH